MTVSLAQPVTVLACTRIWGRAEVSIPDGEALSAGIEVTGVIALMDRASV